MSKLSRIHPTESPTFSPAVSGSSTATSQNNKSASTNKLQGHKGLIDTNKVEPINSNSTIVNISNSAQRNQISLKDQAVKQQRTKLSDRKPPTKTERLLDAIYFVCPDCSVTQCSTIILGLLLSACLTILFLYLGGFWDTPVSITE